MLTDMLTDLGDADPFGNSLRVVQRPALVTPVPRLD